MRKQRFVASVLLVVVGGFGAITMAKVPRPSRAWLHLSQSAAATAGQQIDSRPQAVPATRRFSTDSGIIFNIIKPDKTAEFESLMLKVKEGLAQTKDPKRKQMALSWRVLKGQELGFGGNVVYVWWLDPPVHDIDYSITDVFIDAFPNDAQDLWSRYVACFASPPTMLSLQDVVNMSPNSAAKSK